MQYLCLNPRVLTTPERVHRYFAAQLALPDAYGQRLDALYAVLAAYDRPLTLLCLRFAREGVVLYPHMEPFYATISDAGMVNPTLRIDIQTLPAR